MSVIVLLAVGSDYNLFWFPHFKEGIPGALKTGIIQAMGGTGSVVTAAGLVFAFTMASMVVSDLRILDQIGTTIGLGLLFDTVGCAVVHDAGHRHAPRSVVLVAHKFPRCAHASGVGAG